jgi:H+-transporting ATPase
LFRTDRVLPSNTPDEWDLAEIFAYAIAYGIYLAIGTIVFYIMIVNTTFCSDKLGLRNITDAADPQLKMVIYLQVAQISQALVRL